MEQDGAEYGIHPLQLQLLLQLLRRTLRNRTAGYEGLARQGSVVVSPLTIYGPAYLQQLELPADVFDLALHSFFSELNRKGL